MRRLKGGDRREPGGLGGRLPPEIHLLREWAEVTSPLILRSSIISISALTRPTSHFGQIG
jgi:hypothetical protein